MFQKMAILLKVGMNWEKRINMGIRIAYETFKICTYFVIQTIQFDETSIYLSVESFLAYDISSFFLWYYDIDRSPIDKKTTLHLIVAIIF